MRVLGCTAFLIHQGREWIGTAHVGVTETKESLHKELCRCISHLAVKLDELHAWGEAEVGFYLELQQVPVSLETYLKVHDEAEKSKSRAQGMKWVESERSVRKDEVQNG